MLHFCSWSERIRSAGSNSPCIRKCPFTHASRKIISQCSFLKCLRLSTRPVIPEKCPGFSSVTVTRCYSSVKVSSWNLKSLIRKQKKISEKNPQKTNQKPKQTSVLFPALWNRLITVRLVRNTSQNFLQMWVNLTHLSQQWINSDCYNSGAFISLALTADIFWEGSTPWHSLCLPNRTHSVVLHDIQVKHLIQSFSRGPERGMPY